MNREEIKAAAKKHIKEDHFNDIEFDTRSIEVLTLYFMSGYAPELALQDACRITNEIVDELFQEYMEMRRKNNVENHD